MKGAALPHSRYWKHSSAIANSGEREPALVLIAVDVVGLEGVEAFLVHFAIRPLTIGARTPIRRCRATARPATRRGPGRAPSPGCPVATEALPGARVHVTAKTPRAPERLAGARIFPASTSGRPSPAPTGWGAPPRSRRRRRPSAAMCVRRCNSKKISGRTRARGNPGRPEPSSYPKRAGLGREALRQTPRCSPPGQEARVRLPSIVRRSASIPTAGRLK
jgi:hypothetical protein